MSIERDDNILNGEPHIEGTRISAWKIYDMHTTLDMSPEEIASELPTVDAKDAREAIRYMEEKEEGSRTAIQA